MQKLLTIIVVFTCLVLPVSADNIRLDLLMPGAMFGPGSPFSLDLGIENTGQEIADAALFVALTVGDGDFWFYPSWAQYPPTIDWEEITVPSTYKDQWSIITEFSWPYSAGSFDEAMFLAAILHHDHIVSNLAQISFGWSEEAQPTPTPTPKPPDGFVFIPPGLYMRGSPDDEPCRFSDEAQHPVTLTRGFYMMSTEVTRQMWADLKATQPTLPDDPSLNSSPTINHPVNRVAWFDAVLYANLLSVQNGCTPCYYKDAAFTIPVDITNYDNYEEIYCDFDADGYRLPTEAEWEYAARAETTGPFSTDEPDYTSANCGTCFPNLELSALDSIAWWCGNSYGYAHPVGTKQPNPFGLYDMHGNVFEWCWDWYGEYPSGQVTNPSGPLSGSYRVLRGGSNNYTARSCRSAFRFFHVASVRNRNHGFRLVRNAP